jgi:hypothetical protein
MTATDNPLIPPGYDCIGCASTTEPCPWHIDPNDPESGYLIRNKKENA